MNTKEALALAVAVAKANTVRRLQRDAHADIVCEDNLIYMRRLASASMKLIVTSPPYNIGKEYEEKKTLEKYTEEQAACIAEAVRLLHPRGSICWQVGNDGAPNHLYDVDVQPCTGGRVCGGPTLHP